MHSEVAYVDVTIEAPIMKICTIQWRYCRGMILAEARSTIMMVEASLKFEACRSEPWLVNALH